MIYHSRTPGSYSANPFARVPGRPGIAGDAHYVVSGLANGTHYFTVSACDVTGNESGKSNEVSWVISGSAEPSDPPNTTTVAPKTCKTQPTVVTGLTATAQPGPAVDISWTASTDGDSFTAPRYTLERCIGLGCTSGFTTVGTIDGTTRRDTGVYDGTVYGYRVSAFDTDGYVAAPSSVVYATTPTVGGGTAPVLSVTANGRFALNGTPTFLQGIAYHDCANYHTSDVDSLTASGVLLFLCHADSLSRTNANSLYNSDGTLKTAKQTAIGAFIDYVGTKGGVVALALLYAGGTDSSAYLTTGAARTTAIQQVLAAYGTKPNIFFPVVTSHNSGAWADTEAEASALLATARTSCPSCVLTYSSADISTAHLFTSQSGSTVDSGVLAAEVATGMNTQSINPARLSGWDALGTARVTNLKTALTALGKANMPVVIESSGREGSNGLGSGSAYIAYAQAMKTAGAAANIFTTDAGDSLSGGTLVSQLDAVELSFVGGVKAALQAATTLVPDTPLYTETCTGTGADLGALWDHGYAEYPGYVQRVSGRCQASGVSAAAIDVYNGTVPSNKRIAVDTPSWNNTGTDMQLALGFWMAPPTQDFLECRFSQFPSNSLQIRRRVGDSLVTLVGRTDLSIPQGVKKECRIIGDAVSMLLDGNTVLSATDTELTPLTLLPSLRIYVSGALTDMEVDTVEIGGFTEAGAYIRPRVTGITVTPGGLTAVPSGSIAYYRVSTDAGDRVYPVDALPGGVLSRGWTSAETFVCVFAQDASHVESTGPSDYQCRPITPGVETDPPYLFNEHPSGAFPAGTTSATVTVETSELSTCRISTTNQTYTAMTASMQTESGVFHSATITGLVNGGAYTRYINCQDTNGNATTDPMVVIWSVLSSGGDTTAPSAVSNISAAPLSSTQVTVSYTQPTDNVAVSHVNVYTCTPSDCAGTKTLVSTASSSPYVLGNLTPRTTYSLALSAVDTSGNEGALSSYVTVTTPAINDPVPPGSVESLRIVTGTNAPVALTWPEVTDNLGVDGYLVERCTGQACTDFVVYAQTPVAAYVDWGTDAGHAYRYRVKAVDLGLNVSPSYSPIVDVWVNTYAGPSLEGCEGC